MRSETEKKIKPDWYCVAIDETAHWNLDDEDRPYIEKMMGLYIYDRNEHTYCCELTPSYYLRFIGGSIWYTDAVTDEIKDRISDKYADSLYSGDDCYMWVAHVEAMAEEYKDHYGEFNEESYAELTPVEMEDAVREYYNGNSPF